MMMNKQKGFTITELLVVLVVICIVPVGWIANIVQMWHNIDGALTAREILRMVGIPVFPLGVVLGWIGIFS
jgi:prepilin-type N-terminal cleavage/methylation domain-containing protein